jgi:hypothetical protein
VSVYRDVRVSAVKRSGLAPAMLHKRSIPAVRIPDEKTNLSASRSRRAALTPSVREGSVGSAAGPRQSRDLSSSYHGRAGPGLR